MKCFIIYANLQIIYGDKGREGDVQEMRQAWKKWENKPKS
jgi:hypothetical protein